jgi:ABC-2 type transport system permease protein
MFEPSRILTIARLAFRSSFRLGRTVGLALLAVCPALIVAAIAGSGGGVANTESAAQTLFEGLTIRIVIGLVVLVVAIGQFRDEIEQDTLTYLTSRSAERPDIVVGKYLGAVGASLCFLLPAAVLPLLVAGLAGAPPPPTAVTEAVLAITLLATLAWSAIFLTLGLLTRNALILGLIYLFLWEELALGLPGDFPKLTVLYYLLNLSNDLVASGPLSGLESGLSTASAVAGPIVVALVFVAFTAIRFRTAETAPGRTSA